MYYKIIVPHYFFANLYRNQYDINNIPTGTIFTAPKQSNFIPNNSCLFLDRQNNTISPAMELDAYAAIEFFDLPTQKSSNLITNESHFHFAEDPLDTILWYTIIGYRGSQIYSIKPLSSVTKIRCRDDYGLYQCGANKIQFLEKQDKKQLYEMALQELNHDPDRYHNIRINPRVQPPTIELLMPYTKIREIIEQKRL